MGHRGKATSGYFALSARRVSERLNYKKIDVIPISYGLLRPGNAGSLANFIVGARYVARIPSVAQCQSDEPERIDGKACHGKACHGKVRHGKRVMALTRGPIRHELLGKAQYLVTPAITLQHPRDGTNLQH